jgi:hypothetical protein
MGYAQPWDLTVRQWRAFLKYSGQDLLVGPGAPVEPHWTFAPSTLAIGLDYEGVWARAETGVFNGRTIRRLCPEDELTVLCIHGSKEQWPKLKWVADVAAYIERHPDVDWHGLARRARQRGLARMLAIGLRLAENLLDIDLPPEAIGGIERDEVGRVLAGRLAERLFAEDRQETSVYQLSRFQLAARERYRDKARYLFNTVTQPRVTHFQSLSVPDALFPLFWPYKLLHDYVAWPVWRFLRPGRPAKPEEEVDAPG